MPRFKNAELFSFLNYYTVKQLQRFPIFTSVSSPDNANEILDKILSTGKVGIVEKGSLLKVTIYMGYNTTIEFPLSSDLGQFVDVGNVKLNSVPINYQFQNMQQTEYSQVNNANFYPQQFTSPIINTSIYSQEDVSGSTHINYNSQGQQFAASGQQQVADIEDPIFTLANNTKKQNVTTISNVVQPMNYYNNNGFQVTDESDEDLNKYFTNNKYVYEQNVVNNEYQSPQVIDNNTYQYGDKYQQNINTNESQIPEVVNSTNQYRINYTQNVVTNDYQVHEIVDNTYQSQKSQVENSNLNNKSNSISLEGTSSDAAYYGKSGDIYNTSNQIPTTQTKVETVTT